jgi:hypothetical protein
MIKDIVVNLSVGPTRDVATDFAVSMAGTFEAHLAGIAFRYNEKAAKTAIGRFDEAAKRAGISTESRMLEVPVASAPGVFASIARRFDLVRDRFASGS